MKATTKEIQNTISPKEALEFLIEGNARFVAQKNETKDLMKDVELSANAQYPFASVLSCIDSRVATELIFDQGIGDLFNVKIAGNAVNTDVIASLEYACHFAGSKLLLVLGHTKCGAITSACQNVEFGNITSLLKKFDVAKSKVNPSEPTSEYVDAVAKQNVLECMSQLRTESPALSKLEQNGDIIIAGAMYDVATGKIELV
ncbi:MAG: carbonic anhydrase [Flavobacteriales bacterium]|nr:carbonic anhydrase [Flavobacteriales bacterium]